VAQNGSYRDPFQNFWNYPQESFVHAEFRAIRKLNEIDCSKFIMVTFRLTRTGLLSSGKPCQNCENFIRHFGFKKVWFSNERRELEEMYL
jgi:tRNA(Arg) A34 adenosine deaminase TadA